MRTRAYMNSKDDHSFEREKQMMQGRVGKTGGEQSCKGESGSDWNPARVHCPSIRGGTPALLSGEDGCSCSQINNVVTALTNERFYFPHE